MWPRNNIFIRRDRPQPYIDLSRKLSLVNQQVINYLLRQLQLELLFGMNAVILITFTQYNYYYYVYNQ